MALTKPRLLVLYAEVMPYNVSCFQNFINTTGGEIVVIQWDASKKLTPFHPQPINGITYYSKTDYDSSKIKDLIDSFQPSALYVAGRMEKDYLVACRYAKSKKIPVIGTSDNQYTGSWKQVVMKTFSGKFYKQYFDYMMVPGLYQYEFMRYLGYERSRILFPQYSADTTLFHHYYEHKSSTAEKKYILFTGRLNHVKGLDVLIDAFMQLKKENVTKLKLIVVGSGPLKETLPKHDDIILYGFLEQKKMIELLPEVKFFCLPSREEPWGVVIHEFSAAGLPIITTNICGAATAFVKHGYNGYLTEPENVADLKKAIRALDSLDDNELEKFGKRSYELSKQINPDLWTSTIKSVINQ